MLLSTLCIQSIHAQLKVGINTSNPVRTFEVYGSGTQNINVASTSGIGGGAGIEFVTGDSANIDTDWRILNDAGNLRFFSGDYNANFFNQERMRFNSAGNFGVGTVIPAARLHIDGGTVSSQQTGGFLTLGFANSHNLVIDQKQIRARNNGGYSPLNIQNMGGNTYAGTEGGNVYLANAYHDANKVGIGTGIPTHKVDVRDSDWQLYLRNADGDANDWYVGASDVDWAIGPYQLVFAPDNSSSSAVFRLMDVSENDGVNAPVIIQSAPSQRLLFDGNEIETAYDGLYINHNTQQETYFNVNGGRVGIGTTNPQSTLHIKTTGSPQALAMERAGVMWRLNPTSDLAWVHQGYILAWVDGASGQWNALSDASMKSNISDYHNVLDDIMHVNTYRYSFRDDPDQREYIGVIAQELQEQFPEFVFEHEGQLGVTYGPLAVAVVGAIQEQQETISTLKEQISILRARLGQSPSK